jgi:hypothetical protein
MIESAPSTTVNMNYEQAQMYCLFLEHNGKKGWRLPTLEEVEHVTNCQYLFLNDVPYHVSNLPISYFERRVIPVR